MGLLLESGANVNRVGEYGSTPLMLALKHCSTETVKLLLAMNADVNVTDEDGDTCTILTLAVKYSTAEAVSVLVENGADPNAVTDSGATLVSVALYCSGLCSVHKISNLLNLSL